MARIHGDVRLRFGSEGVMVISGNPLLAEIAEGSLKAIGKISDLQVEATYHFVFIENKETRVAKRIEKRGNRFTRLFLHVFRRKTERVVEYEECVENPAPLKNKVELHENRLEVWIYTWTGCVNIEASRIAQ